MLAVGLAVAFSVVAVCARATLENARPPERLSDREFWRIVTEFSEPNGYFRSDNLTSNERGFQLVIPDLVRRTAPGGVYLGVGPEQNFTYIVAVRPAFVVIFDIRRGNMLLQLMYKALFELAKDRADFVSLLFSKPRPRGLGPKSTVVELFAAFAGSAGDERLYRQNLTSVADRLAKTRGLPLSKDDLMGIENVYHVFYSRGFAVRPWPSYEDLMTQTDNAGAHRSYLATEESFAILKDLESRNLVVPVVGDFGGPKALRAVGAYLKARKARVSAFYLSNVEQYLYQDQKWSRFCKNVASLPLDTSSTFIRSSSTGGFMRFVSSLGSMPTEVKNCGA